MPPFGAVPGAGLAVAVPDLVEDNTRDVHASQRLFKAHLCFDLFSYRLAPFHDLNTRSGLAFYLRLRR